MSDPKARRRPFKRQDAIGKSGVFERTNTENLPRERASKLARANTENPQRYASTPAEKLTLRVGEVVQNPTVSNFARAVDTLAEIASDKVSSTLRILTKPATTPVTKPATKPVTAVSTHSSRESLLMTDAELEETYLAALAQIELKAGLQWKGIPRP